MNPLALLSFVTGSASFLLKHWKSVLAVVLLLGAGVEGYMLRAKEDARAAASAEASQLKERLAAVTLQQAMDAKRAAADKNTLEQLKKTSGETPTNPAACLDRATVGRVRSVH